MAWKCPVGRKRGTPGGAEEGAPLLPRVQTVARRERGQAWRSSGQGNGGGHGPEGKLRPSGGDGAGEEREREIGKMPQTRHRYITHDS